MWLEVVEVEGAVIFLHGIKKFVRNEIEATSGLWNNWGIVIFPFGGTIANDETLEVITIFSFFHLVLFVVLVDLPSEIWSINTSIGLTSHKEVVVFVFWELDVPLLESFESIFRDTHVVMFHVLGCIGDGESNTSW